nr:hypothetical protein [Micromonospora sp. DSM 115978]
RSSEAVADQVKHLTARAGAGPVGDWLPAKLLDRLDDAERELVLPAATLRVVSDTALQALCPEAAKADRTRLATLQADWSRDTYEDAAGTPVWRMHPLLRGWLLDYAETTSRDDAAKRHLAAAEYYEGLADADAGSNARHVE